MHSVHHAKNATCKFCTPWSSLSHLQAKALSPVLIIAVQQLHLGVLLHGLVDIPAQQVALQVNKLPALAAPAEWISGMAAHTALAHSAFAAEPAVLPGTSCH